MKNVTLFLLILIVVGGGGWLLITHHAQAPIAPSVVDTNNNMNMNDGTDMDGMDTGMPMDDAAGDAIAGTMVDGVHVFIVSAKNFSFSPSILEAKKGEKVRIIFQNTQGMHNFMIDEFGVASQTAKAPYQEILEFTANKTGTFQYYCSVGTHRANGMFGTLTVT